MKLFIDTANVKEIAEALSWGIVDGVTTNPSLVAKEGRSYREILEDICRLTTGPVSAEVIATDAAGMEREGRELAGIAENIVVKLPLTPDGLKVCARFAEEGIATNVTLCFSPAQALLAAKAGATYVSPFVGRLDDVGHDGMQVVRDIVEIYQNYEFPTQVLVASVRHVQHVVEAALLGADVATVPFKVLQQLYHHPLTDAGLARFLSDYHGAQKLQ
ncbi:MAG: fructose-6-phosphate aldolase [Acidobacteriota bacterium]|jgi:transaldolase|uniref:Probable transaldolase n=1 Tax=Thermoanaerobaculum aquaticum TaxID=1312852 RepID=A0A062Y3C5_9BACT|nr:fructose-6-phosphate aldolase [Thermoanaerobaculum aquaticum]KDA54881.1 transaldolase [Thermoanaerobaculum aquaticum]BCW92333.1 MAG: transaldolase [Thermoanaerobaculum sp.]